MGNASGARRRVSAALLFAGLAVTTMLLAGCGEKPVAVVNGEVLSEKEFQRLCETATRVDPQRGTVGMQMLSQWINNTVVSQEAKRLKVYPTDAELKTRVDAYRRQAAWAGSNLDEQLKMRGMSVASFERDLLEGLVNENVLLRGVSVADAELETEWNKQKQMFVQPEQVRIAQITIDTPDVLKRAQSDLAGNTDFALVARTYSKDQFKDQGGEVPGNLPKQVPQGGPVVQEAIDAAFKLKPGEVSDPVKVGATWVIVKLQEKIAEKKPQLDDFKELLRSSIRQQKGQTTGDLQKNQQELVKSQQAAKVEIKRPEYESLAAQIAAGPTGGPGGPGMGGPGAGGPPPAPPQ